VLEDLLRLRESKAGDDAAAGNAGSGDPNSGAW
jgi:hypothetical protein